MGHRTNGPVDSGGVGEVEDAQEIVAGAMATLAQQRLYDAHDDLEAFAPSWRRSLVADNHAVGTIKLYLLSLRQFRAFLIRRGMPRAVASIAREHIEEFLVELRERDRRKPATLLSRYQGLRQFFNWCLDEGEITAHPMARIKYPKVPDDPPQVLGDEDIKRLFHVCEGRSFVDRRDTAILRLLLDTGMRRAEMANIKISDVNWDEQVITVIQKGGDFKYCPFGAKAARDLDRYIRLRTQHKHADSAWLWLSQPGSAGIRCGYDGLYAMLKRRAREAGIPRRIWPHLLRHTFADRWLEAGGQEGDLMHLGGWRNRDTMSRYGRARAASRAREAHKRLSPGDRI